VEVGCPVDHVDRRRAMMAERLAAGMLYRSSWHEAFQDLRAAQNSATFG
jgi:hypothetical protein